MGKEGQDPLATMHSTPTSDPRDDWLGAGGSDDLEWFPEEPTGGPQSRPPQAGAPERQAPGEPPSAGTIRRRREIAIVAAVLAVVALAIVAIVAIGGTGGGGSPATTATTPPATTPVTTPATGTTHTTTTHTTTTTTTTTPSTPGEVTLPASGKLKPGDTGAEVETLQKALVTIGAAPSLTVDGKYGPSTQAAVTAFQQSNGLTADGVVGKETAAAINAALAAHT
jgi:hypothetical protein